MKVILYVKELVLYEHKNILSVANSSAGLRDSDRVETDRKRD